MVGNELEVLVKGIVKKIIAEYSGFNLDREDLISEGYLIAVEQTPSYNPAMGASLNTYLWQQVSFRLRNYVSRVSMKASYGTEEMQRVSMEQIDQEVSICSDLETKMDLDEFALSLGTLEKTAFDMMRAGYTYRQISGNTRLSTGSIANMVKRWREANEV
jgi:RNA polymerase sigma factor (sigma-70 family)